MANISFLLNHFPAGGVERVTINIVPKLVYEKGHKVFIFVYKLYEDKLVDYDLPVTFIQLPYRTTDKRNKVIIEPNLLQGQLLWLVLGAPLGSDVGMLGRCLVSG